MFPIRANEFEARNVERTVLALDEHGGTVEVADEADPLLLVGKVPGSGSRFEDIAHHIAETKKLADALAFDVRQHGLERRQVGMNVTEDCDGLPDGAVL